MRKLAADGRYELAPDELAKIRESFSGYSTNEKETKETLRETFKNKNCLIDTHTAVAVHAALRYASDSKAERKILAVSTASPYKFAADVYTSISGRAPKNELSALRELSELTGTDVPAPLARLSEKEIRHSEIINKCEMADATLKFALD